MWFNSWEFFLFLPAVLAVYYVLTRRAQNIWLIAASYFFYGWWDWRFLSLIILSTTVDYLVSHYIARSQVEAQKKLGLYLSLSLNLGLLATFKYFNFFVDNFIALGATIGLDFDTPVLRLLPPVGISFYTFQTLSYTIDVYRGRQRPADSYIDFALFVTYFPQLVAGPIERASKLLPQIESKRHVSVWMIQTGVFLILIGLFKKVVIADTAGVRVDKIFADPAAMSSLDLWRGMILFSLQIYGDFSGYSNIARGVSRLFGIELSENFLTPYFSKSITEFWRRWHVSLSAWLRDYLYIPLGGNRKGTVNTYRNLMLTMLIGGFWHGASWAFIVWGGFHGAYLAIHKFWLESNWHLKSGQSGVIRRTVFNWLKILLVFHLVSFTWIFFRASDFASALDYISGLFSFRGDFNFRSIAVPAILLMVLFPIEWMQYRKDDLMNFLSLPSLIRGVMYAGMFVSIILLSGNEVPFIYFQF
ncbi:MAG: MBOAT family O-acyltransferase [Pseudomonadota bacterium]